MFPLNINCTSQFAHLDRVNSIGAQKYEQKMRFSNALQLGNSYTMLFYVA